MANEVEGWLWKKVQAAVRRYFRSFPTPSNQMDRALRVSDQGMYRTGWIMGYRAGATAAKRRVK